MSLDISTTHNVTSGLAFTIMPDLFLILTLRDRSDRLCPPNAQNLNMLSGMNDTCIDLYGNLTVVFNLVAF